MKNLPLKLSVKIFKKYLGQLFESGEFDKGGEPHFIQHIAQASLVYKK